MHATASLGTILGIWAHPDDETFMVGGLLHTAVKNGQKVSCVTATKGELGVQNEARWPAETLGQTREAELKSALDILGIQNHTWLNYIDGSCKDVDDTSAVQQLVALIDTHKPDSILTFPPDGLTGHDDHVAVSRWVNLAAEQSIYSPTVWYAVHTQETYDASFKTIHDKLNIYFNIDMPKFVPKKHCDVLLDLPEDTLDKKLQALQAMPSQYEAFFQGISPLEAELAFESEALVKASRWAVL